MISSVTLCVENPIKLSHVCLRHKHMGALVLVLGMWAFIDERFVLRKDHSSFFCYFNTSMFVVSVNILTEM